MLFNSVVFVGFFGVVYTLYLSLQNSRRAQNLLLLAASYVFYAYWDWRFLSLILASTLTDYGLGLLLGKTGDATRADRRLRKSLLACSVALNLSLLGFFKYFNFFTDSFADLLSLVGLRADSVTLGIVLPVGISFYTFQTLSYTIDVYRKKLTPTKNLLDFALFVAFFPQLVAGPIERAANLLPQIERPRRIKLDQVNAGLFLVLWGYFKKVVVADNAGLIADQVFNNYGDHTGLAVLVGVLAFSVQIYGDFSGYSDIARGLSRLMGFELMVNFRLPYFALNPSDFWQRWHISLSSWLRDYLYVPLGGNRGTSLKTYRNLSITMLLGGLWHGAAWNFVIWGAFHGLILVAYRRFERVDMHVDPWSGQYSRLAVGSKMLLMFCLTLLGWLLFRATSVEQIGFMLTNLSLAPSAESLRLLAKLAFFAVPLAIVQLYQYTTRDLLILTKLPIVARAGLYSFMISWIFVFGVRESIEFIYFQF